MGRWEIPVRVVAQGGFATILAGSVFHCRAANALRHAHISVIKHILKKKTEDNQNSQVCVPFSCFLSNEKANIMWNVYRLSSLHSLTCWKTTAYEKQETEYTLAISSNLI